MVAGPGRRNPVQPQIHRASGHGTPQDSRAGPGSGPRPEWIWTPEPTHSALVDRETWDEAQQMGRRHGSARDPDTPTTRPGRRYPLRSRLFCSICHRRMAGQGRTTTKGSSPTTGARTIPPSRATSPPTPTTATSGSAKNPSWPRIAGFFTERVFGPDRAAMLDATLPRTAAAQAARDAARASTLRKKLAKIDVPKPRSSASWRTPQMGCRRPPWRPTGNGSAAGSPSSSPNAPRSKRSSTPHHPITGTRQRPGATG